MNKKRLSVVMAGAMLASSVAPVLAAEVQKSEHSAAYLGELQEELRTLVESKKFASDEKDVNYANKSVYAIFVNDKDTGLDIGSTQKDWQDVFNIIKAGDTVRVWSKGFVEKDGKFYHTETKKDYVRYKKDDLANVVSKLEWPKYSKLVKSVAMQGLEGKEEVVIEFKGDLGAAGDEYGNTMTIKVGNPVYDLDKYYTNSSKTESSEFPTASPGMNLVEPGDFYGFLVKDKEEVDVKVEAEELRAITITPGGNNLTVEELYDGLMLTEKGHDFFTLLKEAKSMGRVVTLIGNKTNSNNVGKVISTESDVADAIKMFESNARFTVKIAAKGNMPEEVYTITGKDELNTERLAKWMIKPLARVDILAGSNRYETAVEIAKEYAGLTGPAATNANKTVKNVVLVNGNALVDGLAAAPLAASKTNMVYNNDNSTWENVSAPILLTEADALPKATKAYLKELMADHLVGGKETAKIHLVGGEAVLNKSLERELKALGFEVERYDGDNREETSLAVAKEIGLDEAFVVGGEGEADAMSIAAVAAKTKTPIVVAKKGGISEDATYELRKSDVTVIGGESVVSKSDYNAIKAEAKGVTRVSGSNRKATNALIISKYYKHTSAGNGFVGSAKNVVVAKDGQRNKTELVDALAAANLASEKQAPIVLATDKLSREQLNALALNAKESYALYQVGHGVSRDVVKTIATHLGLTNR